jgi:hypothetical protein
MPTIRPIDELFPILRNMLPISCYLSADLREIAIITYQKMLNSLKIRDEFETSLVEQQIREEPHHESWSLPANQIR